MRRDQEQLATAYRISELLYKYLHQDLTDEELNELHNWAYSDKRNQELFESMRSADQLEEAMKFFDATDTAAALRSIQHKLTPLTSNEKVVILPVNRWRWVAAAAVTLLIAGLGVIYLGTHKKGDTIQLQAAQPNKNDAAPGGNKAVLVLANGSKIILDNAKNGTLAQQGNAKVLKLASGQLAYTVNNSTPESTNYNVLTTPRGGQYQVVLPDGTKVWLNASTTLRYPTVFTGKERDVELSGEGYFAVAKNTRMPFKVKVNDLTVNVLGTDFDIMAYSDEHTIKTTLLSGSVKITQWNAAKVLEPGDQAQVDQTGKLKVLKAVNTSDVVAWKNGFFGFDKANIQTVMQQLARWYDVDVKYEGVLPSNQLFGGKIQRNLTLSQVLKILEINNVNFKIEGKTLTLLP